MRKTFRVRFTPIKNILTRPVLGSFTGADVNGGDFAAILRLEVAFRGLWHLYTWVGRVCARRQGGGRPTAGHRAAGVPRAGGNSRGQGVCGMSRAAAGWHFRRLPRAAAAFLYGFLGSHTCIRHPLPATGVLQRQWNPG